MNNPTTHGVVVHQDSRPTDYLYRVSIKCLIRNDRGEVLVVKETGRDWWDLPGGGMDHTESLETAIAREMSEEVNLSGNFSYKALEVENPKLLDTINVWQIRLIFTVRPESMQFSPGVDADEIRFIDPESFSTSAVQTERRIAEYAKLDDIRRKP